jgi:hypothetical protein
VRKEHRPAGAYGRLAYARAQSELRISAAIMPIRYTRAYAHARSIVARDRRRATL